MNGFWERVAFAFRCLFSILFYGKIPDDIVRKLVKPAPMSPSATAAAGGRPAAAVSPPAGGLDSRLKKVEPAAETSDRAVQMLALLQRDGRLIDFLAENISPYGDEQLGAAVRAIHETCRRVLDEYLELEPIVNSEENQPVPVPAGFDPATIKLIGNLAGGPPARGVLRHKGWRVKAAKLPPLPPGAGRMVITPAEIEIS